MIEIALIVLFWLVFFAVMAWWFYDYGKTMGFKYLKHNKKQGKVVL